MATEAPPGRITVRILIQGRVQGVGYRAWAAQCAREAGLTGWVRNLADGTVEVLARGPATAVERLVAACRTGPPAARVTAVNTHPIELAGHDHESGFQVRPTGPGVGLPGPTESGL